MHWNQCDFVTMYKRPSIVFPVVKHSYQWFVTYSTTEVHWVHSNVVTSSEEFNHRNNF